MRLSVVFNITFPLAALFLSYVSMPDWDIVMCPILDLNFGHRSDLFFPVLRIWSWIRMLLGLLDPDPIVRGTGTDRSGSFYNQAKVVRKTLIPTVLRLLFYFLSLKNDVSVASKCNKQKTYKKYYL